MRHEERRPDPADAAEPVADHVSCQSWSALTVPGESKTLFPSSIALPPAIHMNGYQVKFW